MSFAATFLIYLTYYIFFEPESWGKPFFYASSFFMVYLGGSILASLIEKDKFNPSVVLAIKMAKLFNLAVEELFFIDEE